MRTMEVTNIVEKVRLRDEVEYSYRYNRLERSQGRHYREIWRKFNEWGAPKMRRGNYRKGKGSKTGNWLEV